jgi:hypothetical protein
LKPRLGRELFEYLGSGRVPYRVLPNPTVATTPIYPDLKYDFHSDVFYLANFEMKEVILPRSIAKHGGLCIIIG